MLRVLFTATILCVALTTAMAERRVALVIGMDRYETIRPLENAVSDTVLVREILEALDFDVVLEPNRDLRRLRRALEDFQNDAKGADVALAFFAGHGVEIAGRNMLLPTDADASSFNALKDSSLPLEELRRAVADVAKAGLIVLDACRNDPFAVVADPNGRGATALKLPKTVKPGLGRMGRAENTLFAFSAAPGETAADGKGHNSPFTTALTKYLGTDGLEIRSVLTLVQQEVYERSEGKQLPYVESGLPRLFFASETSEELPERERLLLAMADLTPEVRSHVERIAIDAGMPLAPLFGALISSNIGKSNHEERSAKLKEAAEAFIKVRDELKTLRSGDERVTALRQEAEEQLSLGAFDGARSKLTEAANIDATSRLTLKANFIERTLSEATTHALNGDAALARLHRLQAVVDFEKAAALYSEIKDDHISSEDRFMLPLTLARIGEIWKKIGNVDGALSSYEAAILATIEFGAKEPDDRRARNVLSFLRFEIGEIASDKKDYKRALRAYINVLDKYKEYAAADPENIELQFDLNYIHYSVAETRAAMGDLDGALLSYRAGISIAEHFAAKYPESDLWPVSEGYEGISEALRNVGDWEGALAAYQNVHAIIESEVAENPEDRGSLFHLGRSFVRIAEMRSKQGDIAGALTSLKQRLKIEVRLAEEKPNDLFKYSDVKNAHEAIGDLLHESGDLTGALHSYEAAHEIIAANLSIDSSYYVRRNVMTSYRRIGEVSRQKGDIRRAMESYVASLDQAKKNVAARPGHDAAQQNLATCYDVIGKFELELSNLAGAAEAYMSALKIREKLAETDKESLALRFDFSKANDTSNKEIGRSTDANGTAQAIEAGRALIRKFVTRGMANRQLSLAHSYENVGDVLAAKGDLNGSLLSYQTGLAIRERFASLDPENAEWQEGLFNSYSRIAKNTGKKMEYFGKALELVERLNANGKLAPDRYGWIELTRERLKEAKAAQ